MFISGVRGHLSGHQIDNLDQWFSKCFVSGAPLHS